MSGVFSKWHTIVDTIWHRYWGHDILKFPKVSRGCPAQKMVVGGSKFESVVMAGKSRSQNVK